MKKILTICALAIGMTASAQSITFENNDYQSVNVYDTWEESPFRTGKLEGNCIVTKNPKKDDGNKSKNVLGFQRSRYGSNTYGARIDLKEPFALTPEIKYVHVKIRKPKAGRTMLVGLGKRTERAGQSKEAEQFWEFSDYTVTPNHWCDAVFPIKGHSGIDIYSLVIIPDCESTHNLKDDFLCYIDDITVNDDPEPRIALVNDNGNEGNGKTRAFCTIHDANRNGEVLAKDWERLGSFKLPAGKEFTIRMNPERGFTYEGVIIRYGNKELRVSKDQFKDDCYTIPASVMIDDIEVEGLFVEKK